MKQRNLLWKDRQKLKSIFERVKQCAYRFSNRRFGEHDDLVQNIMLRILSTAALGRKESWIPNVVRNTAINSYRSYARKEKLTDAYGDDLVEVIDSQRKSWLSPTEQNEFYQHDLDAVMKGLSPQARQVLELLADDCTYQEIADATKVKLGTVRSRVFYARIQARSLLQET